MWNRDINVELQVKGLRIGTGIARYTVDLPTLPVDYAGSSIRGVLRKAARKVVNSISGLDGVESEVFGNENKEGKIQIVVESTNICNSYETYGIKTDPQFGSVKYGHLFSYEYIPVETLKFSVKPLLPLNDKEVLLIYYSLNFLRYESLGGFGSRGFGLIEDVIISDEFKGYIVKRRDKV
jgi:CRISPR type III-B/RAMP module RAMP protein Cmr1